MNARPLAAAPTVAAALLLTALAPGTGLAAPQEEDHHVRREVVVVGSRDGQHPMVLDRLEKRGFLGVQLINLTPELRQHLGASRRSGVLVSRVSPGSPAAEAGVRVGDVITAVDGEPVSTMGQLVGRVSRRQEGDEIELDIVRDGAELNLRATLAQSERRQLEVGQFVWREDDGKPMVYGKPMVFHLDPDAEIERLVVDPETINESVELLLRRLEIQGGFQGRVLLEGEQREELEKRIAELEQRLLEMERQLRERHDD